MKKLRIELEKHTTKLDLSALSNARDLEYVQIIIPDRFRHGAYVKVPEFELDLSPLAELDQLEQLRVMAPETIPPVDLDPLAEHPSLIAINITARLDDLDALKSMRSLVAVRVYAYDTLPNIDGLAGLERLDQVELFRTGVTDLSPLTTSTALSHLTVAWAPLADLGPLAELSSLRYLDIRNTLVTDLQPIASHRDLELFAANETQIRDLSPLAGATKLEQLHAWDTLVEQLPPMHGFDQLSYLGLRNCPLTDIASVSELHALTELDLAGTRVTDADLEHLSGLSKLERLDLDRTQVTAVGVTKLELALPDCTISAPKPTHE